MADTSCETHFVATFWRAVESEHTETDHPRAWKAMSLATPEMLENVGLQKLYDNLRVRFSEGETTELPIVLRDVADDWTLDQLCDLMDASLPPSRLTDYTTMIVKSANEREFGKLCSTALDYLATGKAKDGGKAAAEKLALRLMSIYTGNSESSQGFKSRGQVVQEAKDRAMQDVYGVTLPWEKLEAACGPWVPGEIIGITAYSGEGKSTLAGSMFDGFISQGVPCIPIPTEMGAQWMDRVVAARARVEQWRAEKQKWAGAEEQRSRFLEAYDEIEKLDWLMIERMDISPAEIATAVRVLRKRWNGPVVFIVDHMHRLNYGSEEADKMAGEATRTFKNIAKDLGLIGVLLYQPRKPPQGATNHGPVAGHQIRGHSSIWNELDVHLSPFRAWVRTSMERGQTPWGTVCCDYDELGRPKLAKPDADGAKLDDEHVYVKVDKRRVGGEGPVVILDYDKPSGRVYQFQMNPLRGRDDLRTA